MCRFKKWSLFARALVAVLACWGQVARGQVSDSPEPVFLGTVEIPGTATDRSGLSESLVDGVTHDAVGGISAIEYLGNDRFLLLPDRGPKDGAVPWVCRYHVAQVKLSEPTASLEPVAVTRGNFRAEMEVVDTVLFQHGSRRFSGSAGQLEADERFERRLDPEGIRFDGDGHLFVSDEYGPRLLEFTLAGEWVSEHALPDHYRVRHPRSTKAEENRLNNSGRQSNRGMEGLAYVSATRKIYGLMQSPLLQDCRRGPKLTGRHCRLLELEQDSGQYREYVYRLDRSTNKLNEILSTGDGQFLVIERDGKAGLNAQFKKIIKISLDGATPLASPGPLSPERLPEGCVPVKKTVFIDLLDPRFGIPTDQVPEKVEGLSWGPRWGGMRTLWIACDNDFDRSQPTRIFVFGVPGENSEP